ncbi:ribonuclease III [Enterococcus hirae]|jgi:ribonuclease-3|nr:ribonuclease III [Enterococcaceae bacterium]MCI1919632.1 ribonuclease III [Enterococcaceae bacterium]MDM8212547.1 ribonuclease III [Enterococcus hirae]
MEQAFLEELKTEYGIVFEHVDLLELAFTHSSFVNEHRNLALEDNERVEFLGDAVLELLISRYVYDHYPDLPEGKLTKIRSAIVREESLAKFAQECHFDRYIRLGNGEEANGGRKRPSLLCDLFESFLGALYLDQGLEKALEFIKQVIFPKIESGMFEQEMDYKTRLQEILQHQGDVNIAYQIVGEEGPAHERTFSTEVIADGKVLGLGTGKSKKAAEQDAAKLAIRKLHGIRKDER